MKLERLRLRNFRCYKQEIAVDFDNLTAFVGKNDSGKSTVMDALDIFLNDGCPDKSDACKAGNGQDLTIICEFSDLPLSAVLDEEYPTSLRTEYLLNADGRLEIHKTYSGHLQTPKCTSIAAFAVHPTAAGAEDLLQLKNKELKKRAKDAGADLTGANQAINAQLRQKIREKVGDLKSQPRLIPLDDQNAKSAWEGIKAYIPSFALFKSDRASTDQDPEAQDPLKAAVKEAIKQKEAELTAIFKHVENEVRQIAQKTVEKLKEMDPGLATQLNPQFAAPKWDTLFKASITGDDDIPINKRGSGVKRLILLNFFRAKAEQLSQERKGAAVIYGIEEPETSQHPHNQRMLMVALTQLASTSQVIITTHTPVLARTIPDKCLRYIHVKEDKSRELLKGGETTNALLARSLGVLADNSIKLFIGVEGGHDISFVKHISRVLRAGGVDVLDLEAMELAGEVIFFPLGGSSLALWTSRLGPLNRPEFHLYDRDTPPPGAAQYQAQVDGINRRARCKAVSTAKREIENYVHFEAINQAYGQNSIPLNLRQNFADFDDVPVKIAELVHGASGSSTPWNQLDEELRGKKASKAKGMLCNAAAGLMTKAWLDNIDSTGDVLTWFTQMKTVMEQQ